MLNTTDVVEDDEEVVEQCEICDETEDFCGCQECSHCYEKVGMYDVCEICEDGHPGCCDCCHECMCQECQCCEECGYSGCECANGEFGHSDITPWERRGLNVKNAGGTTDWQAIWPEVDANNFDLCREAADFYLLEAITNGFVNSDKAYVLKEPKASPKELLALIGVTDRRTAERLTMLRERFIETEVTNIPSPLEQTLDSVIREAKHLFETRVERADSVFRAYFHMAVAGEARHHRAIKARILSGNRDRAWSGWRSIYDQVGPAALLDLSTLFLEFGGGTYGGPPWAEACKILHSREVGTLGPTEFLNKKMFVDRAWTLEHNGGCFLNKIPWAIKNPKKWGIDQLKEKILNSHAANPPVWNLMLKVASEKVLVLWDQVWEINNELNGTKNENPHNLFPIVRLLCNGCYSNPEIGHYAHCYVRGNHDFVEGELPSTKEARSWYSIIEDDDWNRHNWQAWDNTETDAILDVNFKVKDPNMPVKVNFSASAYVTVEKKDEPLYTYSHNFMHQFSVIFTPEELEGFEVDAVSVLQSIKEAAYKEAFECYKNYYGYLDTKEEDLRFNVLSGRLNWNSNFKPGNQYRNITDVLSLEPKAHMISLDSLGLDKELLNA